MSPTTKTKNATRPSQRPNAGVAAAGPGALQGAPQIVPEQFADTGLLAHNGTGSPMLAPPGTGVNGAGVQTQAAQAIAITSATIGGLWTNNAQSNAWAYLNGIGWRRISPANAESHEAMLQLCRLALDAGAQVQCEQDGSVIHSLFVW